MLLIKTKVGPSSIEGRGLFTKEELKKGQPIWKKSLQDIVFTFEEYEHLVDLKLSDYLDTYATIEGHGHRFYDFDNCRYMNHSYKPNIVFIGSYGFAAIDIPKGTELTCDYSTITTKEHFKQLI